MKRLREYITISESRQDNLKPANKEELIDIINQRIEEYGPKCDLNDIDVSRVKDMSNLFENSEFDGDISKWDVSNVKSMYNMFENSPLDGKEPSWYRD